jgi:hypothetical protein
LGLKNFSVKLPWLWPPAARIDAPKNLTKFDNFFLLQAARIGVEKEKARTEMRTRH